MDKNQIFSAVQKALTDVPLILIGSGLSASHGLPGMNRLATYLVSELSPLYGGSQPWQQFCDNLDAGQDLESALTDVVLPSEVVDDIRQKTWELVTASDLALYQKIILANERLPLVDLLKKLFQPHPQCIQIITTNYDRVIEYACDIAHIPLNTGFSGEYIGYYNEDFGTRKVVNLVKVHGSLDLFKDTHEESFAMPLCRTIPIGLKPEIITPGISKYQAVLKGIERQLLNQSEKYIREAQAYLCIGYGFNDEQIQESIISNIRAGKPIVVVTKAISDKTAHLLANKATHYITIQEGSDPTTTEFCINKNLFTIDGVYWTLDGLIDIIG